MNRRSFLRRAVAACAALVGADRLRTQVGAQTPVLEAPSSSQAMRGADAGLNRVLAERSSDWDGALRGPLTISFHASQATEEEEAAWDGGYARIDNGDGTYTLTWEGEYARVPKGEGENRADITFPLPSAEWGRYSWSVPYAVRDGTPILLEGDGV